MQEGGVRFQYAADEESVLGVDRTAETEGGVDPSGISFAQLSR